MSITTAQPGWYVIAVAYRQMPPLGTWEECAHLGVFYPVAAWHETKDGLSACFAKEGSPQKTENKAR